MQVIATQDMPKHIQGAIAPQARLSSLALRAGAGGPSAASQAIENHQVSCSPASGRRAASARKSHILIEFGAYRSTFGG